MGRLFICITFLIIGQFIFVSNSIGQLNPSPSQFYFNDLFISVASAGIEKNFKIDASFRNIVPNSFYFSPINYYTSFQAQFKNGNGLGVQFDGKRAGLLENNRIILSYALSLIDGDNKLRVGAGFGTTMNRVNTNPTFIRGEINDPGVFDFNKGKFNLDGSIGMQLVLESRYQLLVGLPSLGNIQMLKNSSAINFTLLNSMIKRKFKIAETNNDFNASGIILEPMIGFRMMQGNKDIFDIGLMVDYNQRIGFISLFHSNLEYAIGLSLPIKQQFILNFIYNSGKLYSRNYMNWGGTLEANFSFKFDTIDSK